MIVENNVRSDCYGYAISCPGVCREGILYPHKHTFPGSCYILGVGRHSTSSLSQVFLHLGSPRTSRSGQVEMEAYVLRFVVWFFINKRLEGL